MKRRCWIKLLFPDGLTCNLYINHKPQKGTMINSKYEVKDTHYFKTVRYDDCAGELLLENVIKLIEHKS